MQLEACGRRERRSRAQGGSFATAGTEPAKQANVEDTRKAGRAGDGEVKHAKSAARQSSGLSKCCCASTPRSRRRCHHGSVRRRPATRRQISPDRVNRKKAQVMTMFRAIRLLASAALVPAYEDDHASDSMSTRICWEYPSFRTADRDPGVSWGRTIAVAPESPPDGE